MEKIPLSFGRGVKMALSRLRTDTLLLSRWDCNVTFDLSRFAQCPTVKDIYIYSENC